MIFYDEADLTEADLTATKRVAAPDSPGAEWAAPVPDIRDFCFRVKAEVFLVGLGGAPDGAHEPTHLPSLSLFPKETWLKQAPRETTRATDQDS
jgi:hypothetical protein